MNNEIITLPERLKRLRLKAGNTQEKLAEELHIGVKAYSKYEQGIARPSYESIVKLAEKYNTTTDYILTGKNPNYNSGLINIPIEAVDDEPKSALLNLQKIIEKKMKQ
ncbi:MAG: helix-turn-helix domain-containing protein [Lachnospiraceae bacterium]|nr:helix-turn-helix domain-containing protein [Lachnospiraceae bacterium]